MSTGYSMRNYSQNLVEDCEKGQATTFKQDSAILVICCVSHVSQPLTAQIYAFELNQSRSFRENMDPSFARSALAFSACFAATTSQCPPRYGTSFEFSAENGDD